MTTKEQRIKVYKEAQNWWDSLSIISQDQFSEEYYGKYLELKMKHDMEPILRKEQITHIYLHEIYTLIHDEND